MFDLLLESYLEENKSNCEDKDEFDAQISFSSTLPPRNTNLVTAGELGLKDDVTGDDPVF